MLLQANISRLDLSSFLEQLTPLAIDLSTDGPVRDIVVERPDGVELVPGQGLRIVTTVRLNCTIAGVHVPITASSAQVLLVPAIVVKDGHEQLAFSLQLEAIDLRHVPGIFDETIVERVNKALAKDDARLSWDFLKTLSFAFDMPARLRSVARITLKAGEGGVRVTEEGFHLVVVFEARVLRSSTSPATPGKADEGHIEA